MLMKTIDYTELFESTTVVHNKNEIILGPCKSKRCIGGYATGTSFELVILQVNNLCMELYTKDNYQAGVESYICCEEISLDPSSIAREVCLFLIRGHSRFLEDCTCYIPLPENRSKQLGINTCRQSRTQCLIQGHRQPISTKMIERELGFAQGQTGEIIRILHDSGCFDEIDEAWALKPLMCTTENDLWNFVRKHPLGVCENNAFIQCAHLWQFVHSLVGRGKLIVMHDNEQRRFFATNPPIDIDADVKNLWHSS